jgi:hypothetical protein
LADSLVAYFGVIQVVHASALVWEVGGLAAGRDLALLAPGPTGGWPAGTLAALIAMGVLDSLVAPISLVFVWGWFRRADWRRWLGGAVLAPVMLSALAFAVVTVPAGVWNMHVAYSLEAILFVPVAALAILHGRWLIRGSLSSRGSAP